MSTFLIISYLLSSSLGLMPSAAPPLCQEWCMCMMTWRDEVWNFPWQIWTPCPPSTLQTGWGCLSVKQKDQVQMKWTVECVSKTFFGSILQSVPEDGSPETVAIVSPPQQMQPAAPPGENTPTTSPLVQIDNRPVRLSAEQVLPRKPSHSITVINVVALITDHWP